jgi:hypothetical protein
MSSWSLTPPTPLDNPDAFAFAEAHSDSPLVFTHFTILLDLAST